MIFSDEDRRMYLDLLRNYSEQHGMDVLEHCLFTASTGESMAQVAAIQESIRHFSHDRAPDAMACTMNRINTIQQM